MRKVLTIALIVLGAMQAFSTPDQINGKTREVIIRHATGHQNPHMVDVLPTALYYETSHVLTVEFPATDFEPYTLSVSSTLTTLDYYVTTPYVCVPIMLTGLTYDIQLETDAGDVYWGVLDLSEATSME